MTAPHEPTLGCSFDDAERSNLRRWVGLSNAAKIEFFEEMVQLAYSSGALAPERLKLRDRAPRDAHPS